MSCMLSCARARSGMLTRHAQHRMQLMMGGVTLLAGHALLCCAVLCTSRCSSIRCAAWSSLRSDGSFGCKPVLLAAVLVPHCTSKLLLVLSTALGAACYRLHFDLDATCGLQQQHSWCSSTVEIDSSVLLSYSLLPAEYLRACQHGCTHVTAVTL